MFVDFNILNQLGSPSINSNTFANRPSAGQVGRLFVSTDTFEIYRDTGTGWDLIGGPGSSTVTGSGAAGQVTYWTGSNSVSGENNLWWDAANNRLGIGTSSPGTKLDIHGTGVLAQLNSTSTTNNSYLAFQRAGTTTIRIGDTYNGGSNYFGIHSNTLSNDIAQFFEATGKTVFNSSQTYSSGLVRANNFEFNLTVPNNTTFTSPNSLSALGTGNFQTYQGNATIPVGARSGLDSFNRIGFSNLGTITVTQSSTIRALSSISSGWDFISTVAGGTITHLSGVRILFPDNNYQPINVTNNYALLIQDQTSNTGTVTYTNRWGIYQEGTSDINYFAGNINIKTTTNTSNALNVNGTALIQGSGVRPVTIDGNIRIKGESGYWVNDYGFIGSSNTYRGGFGVLGLNDTIAYYWIGDSYTGSGLQIDGSTFAATFSNSIKTAAPTTGTAAEWKLGQRVAAAVVLDATQYIEVEVGGTFYKLAIVT